MSSLCRTRIETIEGNELGTNKMKLRLSRIILLIGITCGLSACTASSRNATSTTDVATTSVQTIPKNPKNELELLAKSLEAIDYSRISDSKCGKYAVIVTESDSDLYQWANNEWQSSNYPDNEIIDPAIKVTTRDYTWDKVNDFLMTYQNGGPEGTEYGAILHLDNCRWKWAGFENSEGVHGSVKWLSYDDESDTLSAFDLMPADMGVPEDTRTDIYVRWEGDNVFALVYSMPDLVTAPESGSSTNQGYQKTGPTLLRVECSLRETGMSSSWSGTYYSWTYYNFWSNGTKTVAKMGQGYNPPANC